MKSSDSEAWRMTWKIHRNVIWKIKLSVRVEVVSFVGFLLIWKERKWWRNYRFVYQSALCRLVGLAQISKWIQTTKMIKVPWLVRQILIKLQRWLRTLVYKGRRQDLQAVWFQRRQERKSILSFGFLVLYLSITAWRYQWRIWLRSSLEKIMLCELGGLSPI